MEVAEFLDLVNKRIAMRHCPMFSAIDAYEPPNSGIVHVKVRIHVPHRDTGDMVPVEINRPLPIVGGVDLLSGKQAARWVFDLVRQAYQHEASEHFLLDGERVFDPHARGGE